MFLKSASEHYSAGHSRESLEKRESGTAGIQNVTHAILSTVQSFRIMHGSCISAHYTETADASIHR